MKILLVEDYPKLARATALLLQSEGHIVTVAEGVGTAKQAAADANGAGSPFDVLVCDLGLGDGSGLELMRQLKSIYGIKGVALTGSATDEDVAASREAGFDAYLTKPCSLAKLNSVLTQLAEPDLKNV